MKQKFDRKEAIAAAKIVVDAIKPFCERLLVCGSLRRRKYRVGDVEIVFIPKLLREPDGLFETREYSAVDRELERLLKSGVLAKRKNVNGSEMWGEKNKLAVHCASEIPIDLFATKEAAWWNYVCCRTGGAINNTLIAVAAQRKGIKWNPYSEGFTQLSTGKILPVTSEQDVYRIAGLPYLEPWQRR